MANLFSGHINTNGQYLDLSELTGINFTVDTTYLIQVLHSAWVRVGTIGTGFNISSSPFEYKASVDTLYVKGDFSINIAD